MRYRLFGRNVLNRWALPYGTMCVLHQRSAPLHFIQLVLPHESVLTGYPSACAGCPIELGAHTFQVLGARQNATWQGPELVFTRSDMAPAWMTRGAGPCCAVHDAQERTLYITVYHVHPVAWLSSNGTGSLAWETRKQHDSHDYSFGVVVKGSLKL